MAALSFPFPAVNGQLYPDPPITGVNVYRYDATSNTWRLLGVPNGVIPGVYGDNVTCVQLTVDVTGSITGIVDRPIPNVTNTQKGLLTPGIGLNVTVPGAVDLLPPTAGNIGGVKAGTNIAITSDGTINVTGGGAIGSVSQVDTGTGLTGGPITTTGTISIADTTVTAGSYTLGNFTVNAQGQLTAVSSTSPASVAVTTVSANAGLAGGGGPGPISLAVGAGTGISVDADSVRITDTTVTPGSYTLGNFTVNAQGQLTAASSTSPASVAVTAVTAGTGLYGGGGPGAVTVSLLPPTATVIGGVKAGANITIASDGTISVDGGGTVGSVSQVSTGIGLTGGPITTTGTISLLPPTATVIGGVKQGSNVTISSDGTISAVVTPTTSIQILDDISSQFNDSTTVFNLRISGVPLTELGDITSALFIETGGITQSPFASYSAINSVITFTEAPATGSTFNGRWITNLTTGAGGTGTVTAVTAGTGLSGGVITTSGTLTLNIAGENNTALGGVFVPTNTGLTLSSAGELTLSPPTPGVIGGVKAGTNITIASDGTISASGGGGSVGTLQQVTTAGNTTTNLMRFIDSGSTSNSIDIDPSTGTLSIYPQNVTDPGLYLTPASVAFGNSVGSIFSQGANPCELKFNGSLGVELSTSAASFPVELWAGGKSLIGSPQVSVTGTYTTISNQLIASGLVYPAVDGTAGQALLTNGSGTLSWGVPAGYLQLVSGGGTELLLAPTTSNTGFSTINSLGQQGARIGGDGGAFLTSLQVSSLNYPNSDGTAGQFITTNGLGVLSWATAGGGGGGTVTQVNTGAGLTGGPITSNGTLSIVSQGIVDSMVNNLAAIESSKLQFTQTGSGATPRTVQSRLRETISVKDFGAVGDGITNDTAAIQAAITAAGSNTVYFPKGTYSISSTLNVTANTMFTGEGYESSIKPTSAVSTVVSFAATAPNVSFSNLQIDGSLTAVTTGLKFLGSSNDNGFIQVENCLFVNLSVGIEMQTDSYKITLNYAINTDTFFLGSNTATNALIEANYILGGRYSVHYSANPTQAEGIQIFGNTFLNSGSGARSIWIEAGLEILITGNIIDQVGAGGSAIWIEPSAGQQCNYIKINNNWLVAGSGGTGYAIHCTQPANGIWVDSNTLVSTDDTGTGISILNANGYWIRDNRYLNTFTTTSVLTGSVNANISGNQYTPSVGSQSIEKNFFLNDTYIGGTPTSGNIQLLADGSATVSSLVAANLSYPITDGTSGQILTTNGSGTLSWTSPAGTGSVTRINTGTGLTGGPITSAGTVSIAAGGVTNTEISATAAIVSTKLSYQYPAGATTTSVQTAQDRLKREIFVTDFGATGNGTTNDTTAVQNALDYVNTLGGGTVVFPVGVYACSTLVVNSFTTLLGTGGTIKTFGSPDHQIRLSGGSSNISILNLKFDSPGLNQGTEPEAGVIKDNGGAIAFRLQNCSFYNIPTNLGQGMTALQLYAVSSFVTNNYVDQCGGDCLNFNSTGYNLVSGNYINSGNGGGITFNNDARGCIVGNFVKKCSLGVGSGPTGTTSAPFSEFTIANNVFDSCDYGIQMGWYGNAGREGPTNVSITGNTITRCKSGGIYYGGNLSTVDKYISISNNIVSYTGTADWDGTTNPNADGISLNVCPESSIVGNIVTNVPRFAIFCSTSPGMNVTSNTVKTAASGVVFDTSSTQFIVSLNQIKGTTTGVTTGTGSTNFIDTNNLVTA